MRLLRLAGAVVVSLVVAIVRRAVAVVVVCVTALGMLALGVPMALMSAWPLGRRNGRPWGPSLGPAAPGPPGPSQGPPWAIPGSVAARAPRAAGPHA